MDSDPDFLDLVDELDEIQSQNIDTPNSNSTEPSKPVQSKWDIIKTILQNLKIGEKDIVPVEFVRYWPTQETLPVFVGIVQSAKHHKISRCHDCVLEDVTGTIRGCFDKSFKTIIPGSIVVGTNVPICRPSTFSYNLVFTGQNTQTFRPSYQ